MQCFAVIFAMALPVGISASIIEEGSERANDVTRYASGTVALIGAERSFSLWSASSAATT